MPPRGTATRRGSTRYRSKFEAKIAEDLEARGIAFRYEAERLPYEEPRIYVSDFVLPHAVFVEAKGYFSPQDRKKLLALRRAHPDLDLRLLFERPENKIGKGPHSATYAKWATANGFKWAKGPGIPQEWVLG